MIRMTLAGLSAAAVMWSSVASAHARLVGADPAPNATVSAAQSIHLEFSDELAARFSSFKLTDTDGNPVPMMSMKPRDAKSLDAMPSSKLAPGIYTVSWTAVSTDDGHKTMGSYSFTIQ
jgi:methionine-rich copper-binding protein CopC